MPLTPATTDKFTKVGAPGSATTLAAPGFTTGVSTSIQVGSTTNWQTETKQIFAIDRAQVVNGVEERIAGTYNEFEGIVTGANTISNMVRRLGTAQNYPAGSLTRVYIPVAATRENDMVDGLNQDHNGKGNHKSLTDDNGNEFIERGQVASAVNQVKVSNAITNTAPRVDAAGDDVAVDLYMGGKGTGIAHAENPELVSNFIVPSTGIVAQSAGLVGTFSNITYYINGKRYKKSSIANKTYTASKDTYVDIDISGNVTYVEVANGATTGMTLTANSVRVAKVVTSGAAITSVTQTGADPLGNSIRPAGAVNNAGIDFSSFPQAALASNGYIKIGAIMIAWGSVAASSTGTYQNFPVAFSQAPKIAINLNDPGSQDARAYNITGAGASFRQNYATTTLDVQYIAIGLA